LHESETDRLARIGRRRADADKGGNLVVGVSWLRERHPLLDTCVDEVGGEILRRNRAGGSPVTGERMGQRQVLTDARVGTLCTGRGFEDLDCVIRLARKSER
jgi:hypothetical protein